MQKVTMAVVSPVNLLKTILILALGAYNLVQVPPFFSIQLSLQW